MRIGIIVPIAIMALCAACRSDRGSDWDKNHGSASSDYTSQDYYGPETPSGMHGTRSINDSYYAAENSSASRNARGASDPVGYERDSVTRTTEASYRRDASGARSNGKALIASERGFLENAAQWNMLEVESSQLALDRNIAGADRAFAKMMVEDHGKANRELPDLCREEDCAVQSTLDVDHQRKLDALRALNGTAFAQGYHDLQVKSHDDAIQLFESAVQEGENQQVRDFATRTLPRLRHHRDALDKTSDISG